MGEKRETGAVDCLDVGQIEQAMTRLFRGVIPKAGRKLQPRVEAMERALSERIELCAAHADALLVSDYRSGLVTPSGLLR